MTGQWNDFNDAQSNTNLIPKGTLAKVRLTIRPGGVNGATPMDAGVLKASQSSDAKMLDCEFTVVEGPHARRKFWQSFTVAGGKLDEKGQSIGWKISKSTFRAMVDSALGLDPQPAADLGRNAIAEPHEVAVDPPLLRRRFGWSCPSGRQEASGRLCQPAAECR